MSKTYTFKVIVEQDGNKWHAFCPALESHGAVTWGNTEEEAYRHIHEVVGIIVDELREEGISIPEGPIDSVTVFPDTRVAISV